MAETGSRIIKGDELARVEGEGALRLRIRDGVIRDVKFRIHEPPRFFEALLRGRSYADAPDITARICGICPIAYIMGASHAMEDALKVRIPAPIKALRRLIYCGEWIESHVLHVFLLHAPDFLGYEDAILISKDHPELVATALRLKKLGNRILEVIGGRAIHPVNLKVGGFYKIPSRAAVRSLRDELQWAVETSLEFVKTVAAFDFPDYSYAYNSVALSHPEEYAICEGRLVSSAGLDIPVSEFEQHFDEEHVAHSNALHGVAATGEPYLVGPIARYNLNFEQLSPLARSAAREAGLPRVVDNPFLSIVVRMVEVLYACEEALRLVEAYEEPERAALEISPAAGDGYGCTEASRGICYHHYRLDDEGRITLARIMPPTSQNQKQIERDLWGVVERYMDLSDDKLKWRCEQAIRNYDPCISCATHFLDLSVDRR
ncbi:MAG TPA: Ni/Fe hydrogenase subunit alpha [Rhodobacteraceae bacterium]|nr:Ni/Fe hydrogenase subunit alpha [Paracoccaceae bacterium]